MLGKILCKVNVNPKNAVHLIYNSRLKELLGQKFISTNEDSVKKELKVRKDEIKNSGTSL